MSHTRTILIVTDGKAGHENQSKAFCHALGYAFTRCAVRYPSKLRKALAYVLDTLNVRTSAPFVAESIPPGDYAAVVCTGSTAFYPGKVIARRLGIPVAAILYPSGYRRATFDCIFAPAFDNPSPAANVITVPVNLTATDDAFYTEGTAAFRARYTPTAKPAVGVIIGGPNRVATLDTNFMRRQLDELFAATEGCERWVTTSRRTPPAVEALIDSYPFDYKLLYSRDTFNPIPAFVSCCSRLFVTAESTGMVSEAVTRGTAAVEVLMNISDPTSKFARFIDGLATEGAVHVFDGTCGDARTKIDLAPYFDRARALLRL